MIPYLLGTDYITFFINGKTNIIPSSHPNFSRMIDAVKAQEWDVLPSLIDVAQTIITFSKGSVTVKNGEVMYQGEALHTSLTERILTMMSEGFNVDPMLAFLENLMQNTSKRAVDELYTFLEKAKIPLTEDGHFLAYKRVRSDFKDLYSGTFDNTVGKIVEMARNKVDEDKDRTCSYGLHFCSFSYLPNYYNNSGKVIIVKINPRDVVAIPSDYQNTKGRCCRYEVIGIHEEGDTKEAFSKSVDDTYNNEDTLDEDAWDDIIDDDLDLDLDLDLDDDNDNCCNDCNTCVNCNNQEDLENEDEDDATPDDYKDDRYDDTYDDGYRVGQNTATELLNNGRLTEYNLIKSREITGNKSSEFSLGYHDGYDAIFHSAIIDEKTGAYNSGVVAGKEDFSNGFRYRAKVYPASGVVLTGYASDLQKLFNDGYYKGFYS